MTSCPRQPDVAGFLLGALTIAEERDLMPHVAGCAVCQETLHELGSVPDMLALVPRSLAELIDRSSRTS